MSRSTLISTVSKREKIISKYLFLVIVFIDFKFVIINSVRDYSIGIEHFESLPGYPRTIVERSLRFERNAAHENCMVGSFTYHEDLGNNIMVSGSLALSARGNNHFVQSPMRIPQMPFCEYINTTWRDYVQPTLENCSTFPTLPAEGLCPYPKGNYEVNCSKLILTDKWPNHLPRGLWRLNLTHTKDGVFIGGHIDYLTVYDL